MNNIFKRTFSLLLVLVMCISMLPASASADDTQEPNTAAIFTGTGTELEPYEISSEDELRMVAELVNSSSEHYADAYYIVTSDITFTSPWTPIGTAESPFTGSFNGNGMKLGGLSSFSECEYLGLFGATKGATLTRVALENVNIQADTCKALGAIVGYMQGGMLSESYVTGSAGSTNGYVGGLVGILKGGTVENCYNTAEVSGYDAAGGVVCIALNGAVINCCYGSGYTMTEVWEDMTGYVAARLSDSYISSSYAVQGADYYGLIIPDEFAAEADSYSGFDFDAVWELTSGRPCLINNVQDADQADYLESAASATARNALLIGQVNYNRSSDLVGDKDVVLMSSALDNTTDGWNQIEDIDLTADEILSEIESSYANADPSSINLFYYSGHGVVGGTTAGSLWGVNEKGVTPSQLASVFTSLNGHYFLVIDSCGSGAFITKGAGSDSGSEFNDALIAAFSELESRYIAKSAEFAASKYSVLTACAEDETSTASSSYSTFTRYLVEAGGISSSGNKTSMYGDSNSDNKLSFYEAYIYTKDIISNFSPKYRFTPQLYPSSCSDILFNRVSAPSAPEISLTAQSSSIEIVWNSISNASCYRIYRATSIDGDFSQIGTAYSASYTDSAVNAGTTYYYRVTAVSSSGAESDCSNTASGSITAIASGTCGDSLTWILDLDGLLTVSGTGNMYDYSIGSAPWYSYSSSLITVNISYGVTSIGNCAFSGCSQIGSIQIPSTVTVIGDDAFSSMDSLSAINVDSDNAYFKSSGGVLFSKDMTRLIKCPPLDTEDYVVPDSVIEIDAGAFNGCNVLAEITLPSSVKAIRDSAFGGCENLGTVWFLGKQPQWNTVTVEGGNSSLLNAEIHVQYTVSYDANDGAGAPDAQTEFTGTAVTLDSKKPLRDDYYFLGWAGSDKAEQPEYLPEDIYKDETDIILYAVWSRYPYGDINRDYTVDIQDVYLLRRVSAGLNSLDDEARIISDVYSDGKYNSIDVNMLRRYLAALVSQIPYIPKTS